MTSTRSFSGKDEPITGSDFEEMDNVTQHYKSSTVTGNPIKTAVVLPTTQHEPIPEYTVNVDINKSESPFPEDRGKESCSADGIRKESLDVITTLLPTKKSIIISISNQIKVPLILPKVYLTHGKVFGLFPLRVDSGEICCFALNQTPGFPRGVGGLVTFEIEADTKDKHMCIYVFDPVIGSGSYAFKWKSEIKDYKLLSEKMEKEKWINDTTVSQRHITSDVTGYVISGTMNIDDPLHLCVEVTDSNIEESIYMQMKPTHTSELYKQVKTNLDMLNHGKAVVLMVANRLEEPLDGPETFIVHGRLKGNLPLRVFPGKTEFILLQRKMFGLAGVSGVVTFKLKKIGLKLCIFMKNPVMGFNRYGIKCVKQEKATDINLYEKMESVSSHSFGEIGWKEIEKHGVQVSGFMSQGDPCYLHVVVGKGLE